MMTPEQIAKMKARYPRYTVNGKDFGNDYVQANMYYQIHGGVLMEKLDAFTPAHVLQSTESMS